MAQRGFRGDFVDAAQSEFVRLGAYRLPGAVRRDAAAPARRQHDRVTLVQGRVLRWSREPLQEVEHPFLKETAEMTLLFGKPWMNAFEWKITFTDVASAALSIFEMASKRFSEFFTSILSA